MIYHHMFGAAFDGWDHEHSTLLVDSDGTKRWFDTHGRLHRLDGPAIEKPDGYREWAFHGINHRLDGPAIIWPRRPNPWARFHAIEQADGSLHRYEIAGHPYATVEGFQHAVIRLLLKCSEPTAGVLLEMLKDNLRLLK